MAIERTALPGVGIAHALHTDGGDRVGVISHLTGRRDLVLYDPADPDRAAHTVCLGAAEAGQVADLLRATVTLDHVADLERRLGGVTAARIRIPVGSPWDGCELRATRARTRTGASIVAVVRGTDVTAAPDPSYLLRHDDLVVAVGDDAGVALLTELLTSPAAAG